MKANDLMKTNVGAAKNCERVVLVATCLLDNRREIIEKMIKETDFIAYACPETFHPAMIEYRILCLLRYSNINKLCVISVEGSPYCVTLHFVTDEIKRKFIPDLCIEHYTVEKRKVYSIPPKAIKLARHLAKISKFVKKLNNLG